MAQILLVEDEPAVRRILRLMLEKAGHLVEGADNGQTALAAFERRRFDIIITDIVMPQCNGLEAISSIRGRDADLQIIAMSGGGSMRGVDYLDLARMLGANQTLAKPFTRDALLALVDQALAIPPQCGSR